MKEKVLKSAIFENEKNREIGHAVMAHTLYGILGFLTAKTIVFGNSLPFGTAFVCAVSPDYVPAAAVGGVIGYFFPATGSGAFRYIASLIAAAAIKMLVSVYKRLNDNPLFSAILAFLTLMCTITVAPADHSVPLLICEGLTSALGGYVFSVAAHTNPGEKGGLLPFELASIAITCAIATMGLLPTAIGGVRPAGIVAAAVILIASEYGGLLPATVFGAAFSLSTMLGGNARVYGVYAFLGVIAGVLSDKHRIITALGTLFCTLLSFVLIAPNSIAPLFAECISGTIIFLIAPKGFLRFIGSQLSLIPESDVGKDAAKEIKMRINNASLALLDVSKTAERVSARLNTLNRPDYRVMLSKIEAKVCGECSLRVHCWESKREDTKAAVKHYINHIDLPPERAEAFPAEFSARCLHSVSFGNAVRTEFANFKELCAAERRAAAMQQVIGGQYRCTAEILKSAAGDIDRFEKYDRKTALKAASALKSLGIKPLSAVCRTDRFGRIKLSMDAVPTGGAVINKMQVLRAVSAACERRMDVPQITKGESAVNISICELPLYKAEIGICSLPAKENDPCGDTFRYALVTPGRLICVLSDGMGTGGRAAVDSAFAASCMLRLMESGFEPPTALKIINTAFSCKSSDETTATLDVLVLDLFTGFCDVYKAGAAPTVVIKNGRTGKAECSSLPIGILDEVRFDKAAIKLKENDRLLMLSDGAVCDGTEWIRKDLECKTFESSNEVSEHIAMSASRRSGRKKDDISVLCVTLKTVK